MSAGLVRRAGQRSPVALLKIGLSGGSVLTLAQTIRRLQAHRDGDANASS